MSIKIKNSWNYRDNERWDWEVFVEPGPDETLDEIKYVKYLLHSTFPDPMRIIKDKKDGFRLKSNGWGTFKIRAFVHYKDGRKVKLDHNLELAYDPPKGTSN